jgi:hypothetical protein
MCECRDCNRGADCDNPNCTNDLCPDCEAARDAFANQFSTFEVTFKPQPLVAPGHTETWVRYAKNLRIAILEVVEEFQMVHPHGEIVSIARVEDEARQ